MPTDASDSTNTGSDRSSAADGASLRELIGDPQVRPAFLDDAVVLLDTEVANRGGVSGMAIKGAYKVLKGVKPGMVRSSVDSLLDPFADALQPYYDQHREQGIPLPTLLADRRDDMANSLLAITDARAEHSSHKSLRAAYGKVRGMAHKQVAQSAAGVGELLAKYTG